MVCGRCGSPRGANWFPMNARATMKVLRTVPVNGHWVVACSAGALCPNIKTLQLYKTNVALVIIFSSINAISGWGGAFTIRTRGKPRRGQRA